MPNLSQPAILELQQAAVSVRLDRGALLGGLSPVLLAQLPQRPTPGTQILSDLNVLNEITQVMEGNLPLKIWLMNARALSGPREESLVFQRHLDYLDAPAVAAPAPLDQLPVAPAPAVPPGPHRARLPLLLGAAAVLIAAFVGTATYLLRPRDCGPGRQLYENTCVSQKTIDLVTCLKANKVSRALQATERVLHKSSQDTAAKGDVEVSARIEQEFAQLPKEELQLVLSFCGQSISEAGFKLAPETRISEIVILNEAPAARGLLVDLDNLKISWRAEGPPEDVGVLLEGMENGQKTREHRVSSSEESFIVLNEELRPLLVYRERGRWNRIRAVVKTQNARTTSREFPLHVGIKISIFGVEEKIKVMARIDNETILYYDFDAKVVIPFKRRIEFLTFDGFKYGQNDRPLREPNELAWDDIRLAYFGPDDPRLIRPEPLGLATGRR